MSGLLHLTPQVAAEVLYPKGSIVVCRDCGLPIYKLQASLYLGEPLGKSAWKYAPVGVNDLFELINRTDLEPGVRAAVRALGLDQMVAHCERIPTLKAGDMADCPACKKSFVYAETRGQGDGASSFGDKGYTVQLSTIPPFGQARPVMRGASTV